MKWIECEKEFEENYKKHWKEFIIKYGTGFGRLYNGLNRRKAIAKKFYVQGVLDTYTKLNEELKEDSKCSKK